VWIVDKNHVAGIGRSQGNLHRLEVTNFANQQNIRVLAESCTQGVAVRERIHADFALRDNRLVVFIQVFNRVFDRNRC
jgi:hypothetical protein